MITFFFTVNKSFLNEPHPITIPKKFNHELEQNKYVEQSGNTPIKILAENNKCLQGRIYKGKSGYGKYYQIRAQMGYSSDCFGHLKIGDIVLVCISNLDGIKVKIVEDIKNKYAKLINER
ncbi:MAG: hypothetical protein CVU61_14475 [Deltaproteobacteria bacterium HGW-Deltaproteobacteria-19]|jgi:hypothetical protein|nr:MAG: hypothetical protein CVU61_14475 [Deltaproteobacteria bacterium HGW-Deltaproteobacteria-19]